MVKKLEFLPEAVDVMEKYQFAHAFIAYGGCRVLALWLQNLPSGALPSVHLRSALLRCMERLPITKEDLRKAGEPLLGRIVAQLQTHPEETMTNRKRAQGLVQRWLRQIMAPESDSLDDMGEKVGTIPRPPAETEESVAKLEEESAKRLHPSIPVIQAKDYVIQPVSTAMPIIREKLSMETYKGKLNEVLKFMARPNKRSWKPFSVTEKEPSASQGPETTGEKPLETAPSMPNLEAVRAAYAQRAVSAAPPLTKAERQSISEELLKSWEAYEENFGSLHFRISGQQFEPQLMFHDTLDRHWMSREERGDLLRSRSNLPAAEVRAPFLEALAAHQVVVVAGETGSGKTTQCPNFILEAASATGRGGDVSIICTQPRRIAAVGVATRVAEERGETVGGHVGYAVRLDSRSTRYTRLLFCTTGVLLNRLNASPDLEGVTHIVLDEVHERSLYV
eukprot:g16483.t1